MATLKSGQLPLKKVEFYYKQLLHGTCFCAINPIFCGFFFLTMNVNVWKKQY